MYQPTAEDRATFARALAKSHGTTPRQVRKMRQRGEIKSQAAEMPRDMRGFGREQFFRPEWDHAQKSRDHYWRNIPLGVPQVQKY